MKYTAETNPTSPPEDPSQLPTRLTDLKMIDAIYNYVVYNYKGQWEALSAEEKKPFKGVYKKIRKVYLRITPFRTGDLSDKTQVEATVQAAVNSLFPNTQRIDYKAMTLSSFHNQMFSQKRLRNEK